MLKDTYVVNFPQVLHFGCGSRRQAAAEVDRLLTGQEVRLFLLASKSALASPPGQELLDSLGTRVVGYKCGISSDPPLAEVEECIVALREASANAVLCLGGGSVLDTGKAAAWLSQGSGSVAEYFAGSIPVPEKILPLLALPTTAGTGAEITPNAVLTDAVGGQKRSLRSGLMVPKVAVCDPDFTFSLPRRITADSGLDALTQALESYISLGSSEYSRGLAGRAVALLMRWLPLAWEDGTNREARTRVAEGSMLGALAFSQSSLGAVHGLAHPLGHILQLAHGYTCAVLLPHILAWNLPSCRPALQALAESMSCSGAEALLEKVQALTEQLQVPGNFRAAGLTPAVFDYVVKNCRSGSMRSNPRPMSDDEVIALLQKLS